MVRIDSWGCELQPQLQLQLQLQPNNGPRLVWYLSLAMIKFVHHKRPTKDRSNTQGKGFALGIIS